MLNDEHENFEHFQSKVVFTDEETLALKRLAQASVFLRYILAPILTAIAAFIAAGDTVQHFLANRGAL